MKHIREKVSPRFEGVQYTLSEKPLVFLNLVDFFYIKGLLYGPIPLRRWAMTAEIIIFGKMTWPFSLQAREAKTKEGLRVIFRDVLKDRQALPEMLKLTRGLRQVPVIVEGEKISIGFGGSWVV
jgi:glutaredoxin 3